MKRWFLRDFPALHGIVFKNGVFGGNLTGNLCSGNQLAHIGNLPTIQTRPRQPNRVSNAHRQLAQILSPTKTTKLKSEVCRSNRRFRCEPSRELSQCEPVKRHKAHGQHIFLRCQGVNLVNFNSYLLTVRTYRTYSQAVVQSTVTAHNVRSIDVHMGKSWPP